MCDDKMKTGEFKGMYMRILPEWYVIESIKKNLHKKDGQWRLGGEAAKRGIMRYGRYRGLYVQSVPHHYLQWACNHAISHKWHMPAIDEECRRRGIFQNYAHRGQSKDKAIDID